MRRQLAGCALVLVLMTACAAKPTHDYRTGDVLLDEDFTQSFAWEAYEDAALGTVLRVEDGSYHMTTSGGSYIWGLNAQVHGNVMIETQSTQRSDVDDNAYGVMCRADPNNDGGGYYFLISGDGYWSIRVKRTDEVRSLVDFTRSDAIHTGRSINTIRALCIDDYLALYVNDTFVGETRDDTYATGFAGFVIAASEQGGVDIAFDRVRIVEASLVP